MVEAHTYRWDAVNREGEVMESSVTKKRDKSAALKFPNRALKRHGRAKAIVTDLLSYPAPMQHLGNPERREMGAGRMIGWENCMFPSDDKPGQCCVFEA